MKKKWKIILGIIIAIVALGSMIFNGLKGLEADVLELELRSIAVTFKEEGEIVSEKEQTIHAAFGGEITEVLVEEGQQVKKGDLLAVIDSKELVLQLNQLEAQLKSIQGEKALAYEEPHPSSIKSQELQIKQAQRDLTAAENNYKRMEELYKVGALTTKEFEEAANMLQTARTNLELQQLALSLLYESHKPVESTEQIYEGRIDAINAQIDLLKYQIEKCKIVSPMEGIAANISIKPGDIVAPGSPLLDIFQDESYLVEVFVVTDDIHSIDAGMDVDLIMTRRGEDIVFPGVVKKIAPSAVERISALGLEEQRVEVIVEPSVPQGLKLFPGSRLDVEFTVDKREDKLVVPKTVLFPFKDGDAVWVVRDGKAVVQSVITGFENDREIVIEEGLNTGDLVILNPHLEGLKEGRSISVR